MTRYYTQTRASVHRGVYPLAVEATDLFEGARQTDRRLAGLHRRGDDLHRQRHRRAQPRRLHLGPPERRRAATSWCSPQMEHHSNIVPWQLLCAENAAPSSPTCRCSTTASSTSTRSTRCWRARPSWSRSATSPTWSGTINPIEEIVAPRPRGRRGRRRRRLPGGAADPGRPARARRRLLRLDRPQGLRARPASACCTAAASCWSACPPFIGGGHMIKHGRRHGVHVDRPAVEVRGRHLADRRGDRPGRRRGLDPVDRHRAHPRPRARAHRRRARAPGRGARA